MLCGRNVNGWETFGVAIFTDGLELGATARPSTRLYLREWAAGTGISPGVAGWSWAGRGFNFAGVLAERANREITWRDRLRVAT